MATDVFDRFQLISNLFDLGWILREVVEYECQCGGGGLTSHFVSLQYA